MYKQVSSEHQRFLEVLIIPKVLEHVLIVCIVPVV